MSAVKEFLNRNCVPEDSYVLLNEGPNPRNIRYVDLLHCDTNGDVEPLVKDISAGLPDAVVEIGGQPLIYVIQQDRLGYTNNNQDDLAEALRSLACRADAKFLAVLSPGVVTIYPVRIATEIPNPIKVVSDIGQHFAIRDFLTGNDWPIEKRRRSRTINEQWLDDFLLQLLNSAAETLRNAIPKDALSDESVISLIGRALFSRFLSDRGIITDKDASTIAPNAKSLCELYDSVENAVKTFHWLDKVFNGDLLPLEHSDDYFILFDGLGDGATTVCTVLGNIQYGAVRGQLELDWRGLRFKHIPVDVLSQVYENFYHKFLREQALEDSVHYTPRRLAELLIDGAFEALDPPERHKARVLDPAVGAGVFLVLALRRLVQERWKITKRQPGRKEIREILNNQLCGLDINPGALKVAALSLYLAAIDLDPLPQPVSDLIFKKLFDTVLHCVDDNSLQKGASYRLGSLSNEFMEYFKDKEIAKFDVIIGNPPWTALGGERGKKLEKIVRASIVAKGLEPGPTKEKILRYNTPDQPFIWKAMEWARPGGSIAFLLDGALLFQPESQRMRSLIFKAIRVTGVLNGAALRQTNVWPNVSAQFCLLVAKNEPPNEGDSFYYISPSVEIPLNERGLFRIDPKAAIPVPMSFVGSNPTVFKTLSRGSALDIDLVKKLSALPRVVFGDYLHQLGLKLEVGYIRGKPEQRTRDAEFLLDLKNFSGRDAKKYIVDIEELNPWLFTPPKVQWPRNRDSYRAPLLLFRKAAKLDVSERGALLSESDVAYSESFYGISFSKFPRGKDLALYLYALSYSSIFVYYPLMTSSKFGVERETFYKEDYENCPIVPWEDLSPRQKETAKSVALQIAAGKCPWKELEDFVAEIYKLSKADQQLIKDALDYSLPHLQSYTAASKPIDDTEVTSFIETLRGLVTPFVPAGIALSLDRECESASESWKFFTVSLGRHTRETLGQINVGSLVEAISAPLTASQIRLKLDSNCWLIGQYAQQRYWTKTQARMLALEWINNDFLASLQAS